MNLVFEIFCAICGFILTLALSPSRPSSPVSSGDEDGHTSEENDVESNHDDEPPHVHRAEPPAKNRQITPTPTKQNGSAHRHNLIPIG